jgi:hypothetical protein
MTKAKNFFIPFFCSILILSFLIGAVQFSEVYAAATSILASDFEGADAEWTGTVQTSGTVDLNATANPNGGSEHARCEQAAGSGNRAYMYKNFSTVMYENITLQMFWSLNDTTTNYVYPLYVKSLNGTIIADVGMLNSGFRLYYLNGSSLTLSVVATTFAANTYYNITVGILISNTVGTYATWVNGTLAHNVTGYIDNDNYGDIGYLILGCYGITVASRIMDFDDVQVTSDLPVGDVTAPTYSSLSTSTTIAGASCQFNATFTDETALETDGQYQFGWNSSSSWTWDSAVNFTSTPQTVSVSKTLNLTAGLVIGYQWNFTDNAGNSNNTGIQTLPTTNIYLTLQVRDKDGTDIARVFSVTGTLANSSSLDVDTDATGAYSLATSVGSHTFSVWWGSHLVNASVSYSATANASVNLDTRIEYFASGSSYVLWAITSADLPSASAEPADACKLSPVSFSASPTLKVDVANWLRSTEPTYVNVGGYRFDKTNWAWDDSAKQLTYTLGAGTDTFIIVEWGDSSGSSGSGSSSGPSTPGDSGDGSQDVPDTYVPLPERTPEPKPFVMPVEVTQAVIVSVAALAVVGLLGYVYQARKAQADAAPSWSPKGKEAKRKWQD